MRKYRRAGGRPVTHRGAPVIVLPTDPHEFVCPRNPVPSTTPSKPAAAINPVTPSPTRPPIFGPAVLPQMQRVSIAHYFLHTMEAPPAEEDSETAAWISENLGIPRGSAATIKKVIEDA